MNGIKYYTLGENEEVPYEFVVTRNINGEPEFYASFINTKFLSYGNHVLLKLHQRNDELRAENSKLRELCADMVKMLMLVCWDSVESDEEASQCIYHAEALGIEVGE